ncbi:MAG: colanic acid biosynthesis glycosyltransferase WcaL, partial [Verrucomicrobiaceae bacterium]
PTQTVAGQYVATFLKPEMLHIYRQITALRAFRPVVFCQKRENAEAFPFDSIVTLKKPRTHQLRRLWQKQLLGRPITIYHAEACRLERSLEVSGAKLLHIYFGHIGVHLLPFLRLRAIPTIVSFHGADAQVELDRPVHRRMTQEMLSLATLVLARSESLIERIEALGCDRSKLRIHRTGLPLEEIPIVRRKPPSDDAWKCVQACRLIAKKGLGTSLRAFAGFAQKYPSATFTIAGDGPALPDLREQAAQLGIAERVRFTGFLSQEQLRKLYAESHLFLHPSELGPDGDQEGVPNSLLEAMASGLPVLATTHGGIPEAVEHGRTGLLVPERDHTALAREMKMLAGSPGRYQEIALAGAQSVRERFDLAAQTRVLESYYSEAIQRGVGRRSP